MRKESFTMHGVSELVLKYKLPPIVEGVITSTFTGLEGAALGATIQSPDDIIIGAVSGLTAIPLYLRLVDPIGKVSDKRGEALAKICTGEENPAEILGITSKEYDKLDVPINRTPITERRKLAFISLLNCFGAYVFISEIAKGNTTAAIMSAGLTGLCIWESFQIARKSDNRAKVLESYFEKMGYNLS